MFPVVLTVVVTMLPAVLTGTVTSEHPDAAKARMIQWKRSFMPMTTSGGLFCQRRFSPHRMWRIRIPASLIPLALRLLGRIRIRRSLLRVLRSILLLWITLLWWVILRRVGLLGWIVNLLRLRLGRWRLAPVSHGLYAGLGHAARGLHRGPGHRPSSSQRNRNQRTRREKTNQDDQEEAHEVRI